MDGVTFSQGESLTTLDGKISSRQKDIMPGDRPEVPVALDENRAPITEKEFTSSFLSRFRAIR